MNDRAPNNDAAMFSPQLLRWFASVMRPFPWRETYEPYGVWISEIMLQQTQAERGVRHYREWMRRFPDIAAVARADEREVLAAWEGLGYYARARNLHKAAKRVMDRHGGVFPDAIGDIRALPGVGEYTAGAIASIAFNLPVPAVDANVLRIFARLCDIDSPATDRRTRERVVEIVRARMPADSPRLFNQALMELGALICGRTPRCAGCPVAAFCAARERGTASERPVKSAASAYTRLETTAAIVVDGGRVFARKRPDGGLWAGLWEFPGGWTHAGEPAAAAAVRHAGEATGAAVAVRETLPVVRHGYTTHRVTLHGFLCDVRNRSGHGGAENGEWIPIERLPEYAFAAGHRKLLERLGWK